MKIKESSKFFVSFDPCGHFYFVACCFMFALHAKKVTVRGIIREFWLYLFTFQPDKSAQLFIEGV